MAGIAYRWQFTRQGYDITGDMYAAQDADSVRAWQGAHGDLCLVETVRTQRDDWTIATSDRYPVPVELYDTRFDSPQAALDHLAGLAGDTLRPAVCRCGDDGECD